MFRLENRYEIKMPPLAGKDAQQFWIAEQASPGPLLHIEVLQVTDDPNQHLWNTYLTMHAIYASAIVRNRPWDEVKVHILIPGRMTKTGQLGLSKCHNWWACSKISDDQHKCWLFETDLQPFIFPAGGLSFEDVKKELLFWQSAS